MNTTSELILFKDILKRHFKILKWNPSINQIQIILDEINMLDENATDKEVYEIIRNVYSSPLDIAGMEGLDTSKARYLLSKLDSEKKEEGNKESK